MEVGGIIDSFILKRLSRIQKNLRHCPGKLKNLKLYLKIVNLRKMSVKFLVTQPAHTIHNKNKSPALQLSFIPFKDNIKQVNEREEIE